jgi:hypothetical protein
MNKSVVLISSDHTLADMDGKTGKPLIILAYTKAKGGVDNLEQMCGNNTTPKRTLRCPSRVFQHIVDVSAFNAFIVWREVREKRNSNRRPFLKMLGAELYGGRVDDKGNVQLTSSKHSTVTLTSLDYTAVSANLRKQSNNARITQNHFA